MAAAVESSSGNETETDSEYQEPDIKFISDEFPKVILRRSARQSKLLFLIESCNFCTNSLYKTIFFSSVSISEVKFELKHHYKN